jgi:hypothetical protein
MHLYIDWAARTLTDISEVSELLTSEGARVS